MASKKTMRSFMPAMVLVLAFASLASAQPEPERPRADTIRLRALTVAERAALDPHLDRGPVMFVEFARPEDLPGILQAVRVNAPPDVVADVLADPAAYPRFMPALDAIDVESRHGAQTAYTWTWRLAVFTLRGQNVMTRYPGHPTRGHRIDVRSIAGDLGVGRMMWRVLPDGPGRSLLVLSSRVDMRGANWVTEQLASGGNSVNRTINIALSTVMMLGTRREAETRAGYAVPETQQPEIARPEVDFERLAPILGRGDLVLMDMRGDTLDQVTVLGRTGELLGPTREVMVDPEEFGRSLMHGSRARVVERSESGTTFDWGIPLPLINVSGRMVLREEGSIVAVDGVSGSLSDGQWRFDTHVYASGETALYGWTRFDPADSARLIRRLIEGNTYFSHGLVAGTQVMVVRSVRARIQHRQVARAEAARAEAAARQAAAAEARGVVASGAEVSAGQR